MIRRAQRWHPVATPPVGLVRPVRLDPAGLSGPTKAQARGPRWIRTNQGWYVPSDAPRHLPEQLVLEESVRLPAHGAVTGEAALRLWGGAFFDLHGRDGRTRLPVHLNVGPKGHLASTRNARAVHHTLLPHERASRYGIATVLPERAAYDAIRLTSDQRRRVVIADMLAAADLTSYELIRAYADEQAQHRRLVLAALDLASEHSRSPRESEMRLIAELDVGLQGLLVNCSLYTLAGQWVADPDLLHVASGTTFEMDGDDHRSATRQADDLERTRRVTSVGLEECRVVGFETDRPGAVAQRMRHALGRAAWLPQGQRRWVAVPRPDRLHERVLRAREGWWRADGA